MVEFLKEIWLVPVMGDQITAMFNIVIVKMGGAVFIYSYNAPVLEARGCGNTIFVGLHGSLRL